MKTDAVNYKPAYISKKVQQKKNKRYSNKRNLNYGENKEF